jgi:DNA gyrase subunit A
MGVKAIELSSDDEVVGMQIDTQGDSLLLVTENGIGKRTTLDKFRLQKRGGKGLRCYKITEKTGRIVGVKAVNDEHEIMMITTEGIIIQIRMSDIRELGRMTTGVKLMNLEDDVKIAKIAKVRDKVQDDNGIEIDLPESEDDVEEDEVEEAFETGND